MVDVPFYKKGPPSRGIRGSIKHFVMDVDGTGTVDAEADTVQKRLFGRFFHEVDECRSLMEGHSAVAGGGAVLRALLPAPGREPDDFSLYVPGERLGGGKFMQWNEYFRSQGYELSYHKSMSQVSLAIWFSLGG